MSTIVVLFLLLVAMPAALMGIAHVYAVYAQDVKDHYLVVLTPGSSSEFVAGEHAQRYGAQIDRVWDSPSMKGYSALISVRRVGALERDRNVIRVERREQDEFLRPD